LPKLIFFIRSDDLIQGEFLLVVDIAFKLVCGVFEQRYCGIFPFVRIIYFPNELQEAGHDDECVDVDKSFFAEPFHGVQDKVFACVVYQESLVAVDAGCPGINFASWDSGGRVAGYWFGAHDGAKVEREGVVAMGKTTLI
jgi:hypothetical protein